MKYKRIVLKLSGEALTGSKTSNIDPDVLEQYCAEIKEVKDQDVQLAIVIGGGNIFRGGQAEKVACEDFTTPRAEFDQRELTLQ